MSAKKDAKAVDKLFRQFLKDAAPYLMGKDGKEVLKHLNRELQEISDGKSKKMPKRVEKCFGVSLEDQYRAIERSIKGQRAKKMMGGK